jgi:hypothetical protein
MPISKYFKGHGTEVMNNMTKEYGPDKGKQVFYATANKTGQTAEDTSPIQDRSRLHRALDVVLDASFSKGESPREKAGLTVEQWNALPAEKRKELIAKVKDEHPYNAAREAENNAYLRTPQGVNAKAFPMVKTIPVSKRPAKDVRESELDYLDREDAAWIKELKQAGKNIAEIQRYTGFSLKTIQAVLSGKVGDAYGNAMDPKEQQFQFGEELYHANGKEGVYEGPGSTPDRVAVRTANGNEQWDLRRTYRRNARTADGVHEDSVTELTSRIKETVSRLKADGTVSMSENNLKQVVSTRGLRFANPYAFETGFKEAIKRAGVGKFVHAKDAAIKGVFDCG